MCKYCKFTYVCNEVGERSNDVKTIMTMKDGSQVLEVNFNRYQTDDGTNLNELILVEHVKIRNGLHTVKEKLIEIKYCPFCGEKL